VTPTTTAPVVAFETAFQACPVPQALVRVDGTLCRVNAAFATLLDYDVEELAGRHYQELTPSEDAPLDVEGTRRLVEREQSDGSMDKRLVDRAGRAVWVRVSVTPIWADDGSAWGGVASVEPLHARSTRPEAGSQDVDREDRGYWLALHDVLTGAANRLLLHDRIDLARAACARGRGVVAVLFCDIDGFKEINDSFGHERGDEVLTALVRRLQVTLRPDDTVARVGGDEFVVAGHVETPADAAALLDRVRDALDRPLELPGDRTLAVGVSVGLAIGSGEAEAGRLVAEADRAMYAEKARRRLPRQPARP
jgi:diguanylate cyclase (GGDEF)-like protein/PAS domain S-box-containing protein